MGWQAVDPARFSSGEGLFAFPLHL